jgi:hypothetical protein
VRASTGDGGANAQREREAGRNSFAKWSKGPEAHRSAFLVGKISDVVPAPKRPERFLIQFSDYALITVPDVWMKGDRNPVVRVHRRTRHRSGQAEMEADAQVAPTGS